MESLIDQAVDLVRTHLTSDLLKKEYKGKKHPMAGHCYVACEALCAILPETFHPYRLKMPDGTSHWFLRTHLGHRIVDPTADQFPIEPPYEAARRAGFLTKNPCRRTKVLLDRIEDKLEELLEYDREHQDNP